MHITHGSTRSNGPAPNATRSVLLTPSTEEGAHQQLRVQTIGLCPSVLARDSDARGMDDIGLDAAPPQPARQPKAVASGLIGEDDALDFPTRLCRFVAPTLHKLQQLVLVGRKLLQWLALDARDQPLSVPRSRPGFWLAGSAKR